MNPIIRVLRRAREKTGLTQSELAQRMGCARDTIARIEIGRQSITIDQLSGYLKHCQINPKDIIQALEQPRSSNFAYMLRMHNNYFITTQIKTQFEAWYIDCEKALKSEQHLIIREIPHFIHDENQDPRIQGEKAANETRLKWNLGTAPINDPVGLIEELGIYIQGADLGDNDLFALSGKRVNSNQYGMLININKAVTIERQRFSIIHELAHLIAHRAEFSIDYMDTGKGHAKDPKEIYADAFAGAFLAPAEELERFIQIARSKGINDTASLILQSKRYFGISYQTVLMRLRSIDYFRNERQFGILYGKLKKAFGPNEPQPITTPLKFTRFPNTDRVDIPFQMVE